MLTFARRSEFDGNPPVTCLSPIETMFYESVNKGILNTQHPGHIFLNICPP